MLAPMKLSLLFLTACLLLGAEFWDTKPFPEWSDKELQQVMTNSPWARRVEAPTNASPGESGATNAKVPDLSGPTGLRGPTLPVMIRWLSALPMKQGQMRAKYGKDAATSPEAQKFLERQSMLYVVAVTGIPGYYVSAGGGDKARDAITQSTTLTPKGKAPIKPAGIQFAASGPNVEVILGFERANEITLSDQEVELSSIIGTVWVRHKFKLRDMVVKGKLEL